MSSTRHDAENWTPDIKEDMEIFVEYVSETGFRLEQIEATIMKLEGNTKDSEMLSDLLCQYHSIKGSSSILNIEPANNLAHNIESMLEDVIGGKKEVTKEFIDYLFESLDSLKGIVENLKEEIERIQ